MGRRPYDRFWSHQHKIRHRWAAILAVATALVPARATITETQVLVVYNSAAPDATTLKNYYLAAHPGIPAANVFDLNNASLNVADLSYTQFVSLVRDPIRNYINLAGDPTPSGIVSIVLIRPFPHRVQDSDNPGVGDNPGAIGTEVNAGDVTCASLDAELVLLWQNLTTGEAGGTMDSKSDNMIDNPYHQALGPIQNFSRANIQVQKTLTNASNIAWMIGGAGSTILTSGDIYLVSRIDGNSLTDAMAEIDRGRLLFVNKALVKVILDEFDVSTGADLDDDSVFAQFHGGDDYEEARNVLQAQGWNVLYDGAFNFIDAAEETNPLIAYASYGENHSQGGLGENPAGPGTYIDGFNFFPGAIFNTLESYNGRAFNGLPTLFDQEQVADFIAAGGTFGIGMVWEPFSFTVPDNEFLMHRMLVQGFTWGEAAYASLPILSWMHVVVGDPLASATIVNDPTPLLGDMNADGLVNLLDIPLLVDIALNGPAAYHTAFPLLDPYARGDFTGDFKINGADLQGFTDALVP